MTSALVGVPADKIEAAWPHQIGELISQVAARSSKTYTADDIKQSLLSREMQLWISWREGKDPVEALAITEIRNLPRRKIALIIAAVGKNRKNWKHFHTQLEAWAKEQGCTLMRVIARPGWAKELTDYKKTHVILEKEI